MALSSEASSDVLFSLMRGLTSPKEIAEHVGDKAPSVVEQLSKLRKAGYVRRAEKQGKVQPYEIDWEKLILDAIRASPMLLDGFIASELEGKAPSIEGKRPDWEALTRRLWKNQSLRLLVRRYFEAIAKREDEIDVYLTQEYRAGGGASLRGVQTLIEVTRDFELAVIKVFPTLKRDILAAKGLGELYDLLKIWYYFALEAVVVLSVRPLQEALSPMMRLEI